MGEPEGSAEAEMEESRTLYEAPNNQEAQRDLCPTFLNVIVPETDGDRIWLPDYTNTRQD